MNGARQLVVGVGNAFRGDDGVGLAVAGRLRERVPPSTSVVACEREPSRLLEVWSGAESALLIDAVDSGAAPGTLHRFDASRNALPERVFRSSTHAFGLGETIELARALGQLPESVIVHGVEGRAFDAGQALSEPVEAAVDGAVAAVLEDLRQMARRDSDA